MTGTLEYRKGDLVKAFLSGEVQVFAHGANCFCTMGSGIAKQVKAELPELYNEDQKTIKGEVEKLGNVSFFLYENSVAFNLYTQYNYGYNGKRYANYEAIYSSLELMTNCLIHLNGKFSTVGLPKIACGLAGANWNIVEAIIKETLIASGFNVIIFEL